MTKTTNLQTLYGLDTPQVWTTETAFNHLQSQGQADSKRTAERRLHAWRLLPPSLSAENLRDEFDRPAKRLIYQWEIDKARKQRKLTLFLQLHPLPSGQACLHANDARGGHYWRPIAETTTPTLADIVPALKAVQQHFGKDLVIFPHAALLASLRKLEPLAHIRLNLAVYWPVLDLPSRPQQAIPATAHLKQLEAESIHILREAVAEAENPVMLYSIGKDSAVMLHLARKAFYPGLPPLPLMHIDTRWKFQEMYLFRDHIAQRSGMELLVHINPEAIARDINPFDHGSALHTNITKTEGLKQALDHHKFDIVFGGARRDEEKSRAKERIFSFRNHNHRWDPKKQRPELWHLFNTKKSKGESIRVFPLSNWTELDIWQYIYQEHIPIVPLYFAKKRLVVVRDAMILLVDDDRFRLLPGEKIVEKTVRFRTLGCYPLTGAIESDAATLPEIILELIEARNSERQGRAIDSDAAASMEKKKQEGYF